MNISILSGPIIGALIGYGTNWVAIKMLFRPLKPVKIGKFILPFTPGIIPKRKEKLANSIGQMVGNNLLTKNDLQELLLSDKIQKEILCSICEKMKSEMSIKQIITNIVEKEKYVNGREFLKLWMSKKIQDGLLRAKVSEIIATEGGQVIRNKINGSMLKMFVTDGLIDSIVSPMGDEIEKYIKEHGQEKIIPIVEGEITLLENCSIQDWMKKLNLDEQDMKNIIQDAYHKFVKNQISNLLEKMDICKVVENKINQMDILDLEKLLLSIMKKELGAIVNLGALIGLILGTLNIFI